MKQGLFSKYQCDNKLKIYTQVPLNNYQYKKMIENAKPRYMNDYYNAPKFNRRKNEKSFNYLLDSYFSDFKQMKKKFNFMEPEKTQEEYLEEQNNYIDYDEFQNKKKSLYELFSSYDTPDIDQINFDLTDKIVRSMHSNKNDSLLKNTQTKDDYDLRLNDIENNPKYNPSLRKNDQEPVEDSKVINNNEEIEISDKYREDPLKAFQDMVINNDYPLFEQLINPFYPTEYIPQPCFPLKPKEEIDEKDFDKNEENEFEGEFDKEENKEKEEEEYDDFDRDNNENGNSDKDNNENGNNIEEKKDEDENILKLMNNQKINGDNDLLIFEDIISDDFRDDYIIPTYKMPSYIEEEIKKEEEKRKKEKEDYEKNKNQNILNKSENGDIKMINDIIKEEEQNKKVEEINNSDNKIVYNPQNDFQKGENDENNIQNNKNIRYDGYEEGGFIQASANDEIKNDKVEDIINSNKNENNSLKQFSTPNPAQNEEEKKEDMKKEMMGDMVNYDKFKGNDYPTVGEMVRKKYNEDEIKDFDEKEEEKIEEKKEEENKKESINNIVNKSDDNFDKIVVDELNDDEIEDNEEKYGLE